MATIACTIEVPGPPGGESRRLPGVLTTDHPSTAQRHPVVVLRGDAAAALEPAQVFAIHLSTQRLTIAQRQMITTARNLGYYIPHNEPPRRNPWHPSGAT